MENELLISMRAAPTTHVDWLTLHAELAAVIGEANVTSMPTKSFGGWNEFIVILSIGGGVAVKEIASVIRAWLTKQAGRQVNLGNFQFTGYSAAEVKRLIEATNPEQP